MAEGPNLTTEREIPELAAPRRVFKRKRRNGLILTLKILLPLIAVSCIGYIVYWSRQAPIVHAIDVLPSEEWHGAERLRHDGAESPVQRRRCAQSAVLDHRGFRLAAAEGAARAGPRCESRPRQRYRRRGTAGAGAIERRGKG